VGGNAIYIYGDPTDCKSKALGPFVAHSGAGYGMYLAGIVNANLAAISLWHLTGNSGMYMEAAWRNIKFTLLRAYGCATGAIYASTSASFSDWMNVVFQEVSAAGTTTQAQTCFLWSDPAGYRNLEFRIEKGDLGVVAGNRVAHTTADFRLNASSFYRVVINNCLLGSATLFQSSIYGLARSIWRFERYNRTAGDHRTFTPEGQLRIDTTTFDISPSLKMTPLSASLKLESALGLRGRGFQVAVDNGQTTQVSVKVRKDSSYNGAQPRLIMKANSAIGIDIDTVVATMSVGADTWETLTYTTPAASDAGVFEFVVDCDGTAGNVFIDTWAAV
jgi:hypothetical protein